MHIDLQVHTNALPHHSSWQPEALAEHAARLGMRAIAATDHNTTAGVRALLAAGARHGVGVVPGVGVALGVGVGVGSVGSPGFGPIGEDVGGAPGPGPPGPGGYPGFGPRGDDVGIEIEEVTPPSPSAATTAEGEVTEDSGFDWQAIATNAPIRTAERKTVSFFMRPHDDPGTQMPEIEGQEADTSTPRVSSGA